MQNARISFLPRDNPKPEVVAGGIADENGIYQLTSYAPKDGSPAGEFIVTISWPKPGLAMDESGSLPDNLKGVYSNRSSKLRVPVAPQNIAIDFDLK